MVALALALSSSLCWGFSDFLGGLQARRLPLLEVMVVSQTIGLIALLVVVAARGHGPPELVKLVPAGVAGLAGVAALTAFYRALAIGTMSIVAPVAATGVIVPVVVGIAGGDRPAAIQLAGILAAIAGVVLASRESGPETSRAGARASVALALVAAAGFGSFAVGLRTSARADVLWALLAARGTAVALVAAAVAARRPPWTGGWPATGRLTVIGILDVSAISLYALATRHGLLSVVAVGASLYPLVTVVLARAVLGERVQRVQEVGIVAALAGIVLMAVG
jgi:drug/metabolite transporter (DMT)-like permease